MQEEIKLKNNIFKFAKKELSQDAFISWLINYINTDEEQYKKEAKKFISMLCNKIGNERLIYYINNNDYKVDIKLQYKKIDILLVIGEFYIIIEDKILTKEHNDQIKRYRSELIKTKVPKSNIFIFYYKMFEEYNNCPNNEYKSITRQDMIKFLDAITNRNMILEDYYKYLKEIEKYSRKRDVIAKEINKIKSNEVDNIQGAIYTGFYGELEKEGKNIEGWGYADNKSGGTWWYSSEMYKNIISNDYERIYAEINLKDNRNYIILKLAKKCKEIKLDKNTEKKIRNKEI